MTRYSVVGLAGVVCASFVVMHSHAEPAPGRSDDGASVVSRPFNLQAFTLGAGLLPDEKAGDNGVTTVAPRHARPESLTTRYEPSLRRRATVPRAIRQNQWQQPPSTQTRRGSVTALVPAAGDAIGVDAAVAALAAGTFEGDLAVAQFVASPTAGIETGTTTIHLEWTVRNEGTTAIAAGWVDTVVLSVDEVFSCDDRHVTGWDTEDIAELAPQGEYSRVRDMTFPTCVASGDYYLILKTDVRSCDAGDPGERVEPNENNNVVALPITISDVAPVDLAPTNFSASQTAGLQTGQSVDLAWAVRNNGAGAATGGWPDRVFFSRDPAWTDDDLAVTDEWTWDLQPLEAGAAYARTKTARIPTSVGPGTYYLILVIDHRWSGPKQYDLQHETNETNNTRVLPVEVVAVADIDLIPESLTVAPAVDLATGQEILVSWSVRNQGAESAIGGAADEVFLSWDDHLDPGDVCIGGYWWDGHYWSESHRLDADGTRAISVPACLPTRLAAGGTYYILCSVDHKWWGPDDTDSQHETDETNNTLATPITITAIANVDLEPTAFTATPAAGLVTGQSVELSWTVRNNGSDAAAGDWSDRVFLSRDSILTADDILVVDRWTGDVEPLAGGAAYDRLESIVLPTSVGPGTYCFILAVDHQWSGSGDDDLQKETDESNNTRSIQVEISGAADVDLEPTAFSATPAAGLTTGQSVELSWTVRNNGSDSAAGGWPDRIFLSRDANLDDGDVQMVDQWTWDEQPLVSNASYARSQSAAIPTAVSPGSYYLILMTDQHCQSSGCTDCQFETNEDNNTRAIPIEITGAAQIDLEPTAFTVTPAAGLTTGQNIALSWTVANHGADSAIGSWGDDVFLSSDNELDAHDIHVTGFWDSRQVAPAREYSHTVSLRLPTFAAPGSYYLIVSADHAWWGPADTDHQYETDEDNNTLAIPLVIDTASAIDLQIVTLTVTPASGITGRPADGGTGIQVNAVVRNNGPNAVVGGWDTSLYLSSDPMPQHGIDFPVAYYHHRNDGGLAAGETAAVDITVWLPTSVQPGSYYITAHTDEWDGQFETNETNNTAGVAIEITAAADVDLVPVRLEPLGVPPVLLDAEVELRVTVRNNGPHAIVADFVDYTIFVSRDDQFRLDGSDPEVRRSFHNFARINEWQNGLLPGDELTFTVQVSVSSVWGIAGSAYLFVECDTPNWISESNENNNVFGAAITLQPSCSESEPNADASTASGPLEVARPCFGQLDGAGDVDVFAFPYEAGRLMTVELLSSVVLTPGTSMSLDVTDVTGAVLFEGVTTPVVMSGWQTGLVAVFFRADESGIAYARVSGVVPEAAPYVIYVAEPETDPEPNDTIAEAYVPTSSFVTGALAGEGDVDFSVVVAGLPGYPPLVVDASVISLAVPYGVLAHPTFSATTRIHDAAGVPVGESVRMDVSVGGGVTVPIALAWADFTIGDPRYVSVGTGDASNPLLYSLITNILSFRGTPDAFENNDTRDSSVPLHVEVGASQSLAATCDGAADKDFYAVTLSANQFVQVSVAPQPGTQMFLPPNVILCDSPGAVLVRGSVSPTGSSTELVFQAPADGVYLIGIAPWPAEPDAPNTRGFAAESPYQLSLSVTEQAEGHFWARLVLPSAVRVNRDFTFWIEYGNSGTADMPAPLLVISSPSGAPMALENGGLFAEGPRQVMAFGTSGMADALKAGDHGRVGIRSRGINIGDNRIEFNLAMLTAEGEAVPIDWASVSNEVKPEYVSEDAWSAVWANLSAQVGGTWGDHVGALHDNAAYLESIGQSVNDASWLWAFELDKASGLSPHAYLAAGVDAAMPAPGLPLTFGRTFGQSILSRYALGSLGRGWCHNWDIKVQMLSAGDVLVRGIGGADRYFQNTGTESYTATPGDYGKLRLDAGVYRLTEKDGTIWQFRGDLLLDYVEDTNHNRISLTYAGSLLTALAHSNGTQIQLHYNADGRIDQLTDPAGRTTVYAYDGEHLRSVTAPGARVTQYTYSIGAGAAREHALLAVTYPDGAHDFFTYDASGRLIGTHGDGGAEAIVFAYDADGRITLQDATGRQSVMALGLGQQLGQAIDGTGATLNVRYGPNQEVIGVTGPAGQQYRYSYDTKGNVVGMEDASGSLTRIGYEPQHNLLSSLTDARGQTLHYAHDAAGNVSSITYPDGMNESFTYDARGNVLTTTNRRGQMVTYTYNAAGQVLTRDYVNTPGVDFTYTYDGSTAKLTSATDANGTAMLAYYAGTGWLQRIEYPGGKFFTFEYDAAGRRTRRTDQDARSLNYQYDVVGRLMRMTDETGSEVIRYEYDAAGRLSRENKGNGTYTMYEYDAAGQVLHMVNCAPDGTVQSRFDYTYDVNGNRTSMATLSGTWQYAYDALGQLVGVTHPDGHIVTYVYDAVGNRVTVTDNGATTAYTTNNMNQYTQVGDTTYTYDADGNMTSRTDSTGATTYEYDIENRLIRVAAPSGDAWQYTYDALGNRIKVEHNGTMTRYVHDPIGLVDVAFEYNAAGALIARYNHGIGLISRSDATGNDSYYSYDAMGHTRQITSATGIVVNTYEYDPFGVELQASGPVPNRFHYGGQWGAVAEDYSVSYLRARFFDPKIGRFLTPDPIGLGGGDANLYACVGNNPVTDTDPPGLAAATVEEIRRALGRAYPSESTERSALNNVRWWNPISWIGGFYLLQTSPHAYQLKTLEKVAYGEIPQQEYERDLDVLRSVSALGTRGLLTVVDQIRGFVEPPGVDQYFTPEPDPPTHTVDKGSADKSDSSDPNEKVGPAGFGTQGFVTSGQAMPYTVFFENDAATASAAVIEVRMMDPLNANLDYASFELTEVGFDSYRIAIPVGASSYEGEVEIDGWTWNAAEGWHRSGALPLVVHVQAGIDQGSGVASWRIWATDPFGHDPYDAYGDAYVGFLPPNDPGSHRGEGFVSYILRPKANLPSGTEIRNVATIIFDDNESIDTNQVNPHDPSQGTDPAKECLNTIDAGHPTSFVNVLPSSVGSASFEVSCAGEDDAGGSGIARYEIYVSEDGGPFTPWQTGDGSPATFNGQNGRMYAFYSVAVDNVGHREISPLVPDATTRVQVSGGGGGGGGSGGGGGLPVDECPDDSDKTEAGICGCGIPDDDTDADDVPDCIDNCAGVRNTNQVDMDADGVGDSCDVCPDDPDPSQLDTDGDGVGNACDNCPAATNKDQADSDGDGLGDVCDRCPNDAAKASPGICGCGVADADSDGDGVLDCNDACPGTQAGVSVGADGCELAPPSGQPVPEPNNGTPGSPGGSGQNQSNAPPVAPICGVGIAQTMLPCVLVLSFVHATRRRRR